MSVARSCTLSVYHTSRTRNNGIIVFRNAYEFRGVMMLVMPCLVAIFIDQCFESISESHVAVLVSLVSVIRTIDESAWVRPFPETQS